MQADRRRGMMGQFGLPGAFALIIVALSAATLSAQEPSRPAQGEPQAAPPVHAPPQPFRYDTDETYRRCLDTSDGTNAAWGVCGGALVAREDARLNAAWRRAYATGGETQAGKAALLDEQRAWLAFLDKSCLVYASGDHGREGQVLSFPICRAGVIAARTAELDAYADGEQ